MKVLLVNTNKPLEVNDGYGMRLIEQGKAVPHPVVEVPPQKANPERSVPMKKKR